MPNINHPYNTRRKVAINNAIKNIQKRIRGELIRNKLARLRKYKICAICLEKMYYKNCIFLKDCDHIFHNCCITRWIKIENTCPNCRTEIVYKIRKKHSWFFMLFRRLLQID